MKSQHSVELYQWIGTNKESLNSPNRGTLKQLAVRAGDELGFKVSSSSLSPLMRMHGLETRRRSAKQSEKQAMQAEIEKLTAEVAELRRTLVKVHVADFIPEDYKDFIFAGLNEEVRAAIVKLRESS